MSFRRLARRKLAIIVTFISQDFACESWRLPYDTVQMINSVFCTKWAISSWSEQWDALGSLFLLNVNQWNVRFYTYSFNFSLLTDVYSSSSSFCSLCVYKAVESFNPKPFARWRWIATRGQVLSADRSRTMRSPPKEIGLNERGRERVYFWSFIPMGMWTSAWWITTIASKDRRNGEKNRKEQNHRFPTIDGKTPTDRRGRSSSFPLMFSLGPLFAHHKQANG